MGERLDLSGWEFDAVAGFLFRWINNPDHSQTEQRIDANGLMQALRESYEREDLASTAMQGAMQLASKVEAERDALRERLDACSMASLALKERVRVLEEESLTNLVSALTGAGNHTDSEDMLRIGLRAISCAKAGFARLTRHVHGGYAEIIAKAIAGGKGEG